MILPGVLDSGNTVTGGQEGTALPVAAFSHDLLEKLHEVVFQMNPHGEWTFLNSAWTEKTGWSRGESLGKSCLEFIHKDDIDFVTEKVRAVLTQRKDCNVEEVRFYNAWGDYTCFEIYACPLFDENGEFRGILGTMHDITDRKSAATALEFRLEFERLITTVSSRFINLSHEDIDKEIHYALETIGHFLHLDRSYIHLLDDTGTRFSCTHEWCNEGIESYKPKIQGIWYDQNSWWAKTLDKSRDLVINDVDQLPPEASEVKKMMKEFNILSIAALQLECKGQIIGLMGFDTILGYRKWDRNMMGLIRTFGEIMTSAFERKRAETVLKQSEQRYYNLFNSVAEGLGSVDSDEVIQFCNPAFARIFEAGDPRDLIGKSLLDFVEEEQRDYLQIQTEIRRNNKSSQYELPILTALGNKRTILASASPRFDDDGNYLGAFANIVDITERRHLEEQLEYLTGAAEAASRAKSVFLANMSHELRTPLNSIIGFAELMQEGTVGELNESQKDYVNIICQSGKHLLDIINDVLDLAKIEAGKLKIHVGEFDLRQLLRQGLEMVKSLAIKNKITLEADIGEVGIIIADEQKTRQIVYNLLSNAIKFTPPDGKVGIECRKKQNSVVVTVWDTGIGLKREDLKIIFGEFQQVDTSYTKKYQGTGLGLALSKKLIEIQGGQIWVESQPGTGSRFSFRLPLRVLDRKVDQDAD